MAMLRVASWYSTCGACGRQVLPHEKKHEWVSGYHTDKIPGCGATFTHIESSYIWPDMEELEATLRDMRPDLTLVVSYDPQN